MQQTITIRQFSPGCGQGLVVVKGVVQRTVKTRRVKVGYAGIFSGPIKWREYSYIEFAGEEYEIRWEQKYWDASGKEIDTGRWELTLHGDAKLAPDVSA